jgi:F-type H+-transporting ATPase subunit gamma
MYETVSSILSKSGNIQHRYLMSGESDKKAVIVITSDRGLAGGYNSNVEKLVTGSDLPVGDVRLYTIGSKGRDNLSKKGYAVAKDYEGVIDAPTYRAAQDIGADVLEAFSSGEVGEIWMAYTVFKNTITHIPKMIRLLPVSIPESEAAEEADAAGRRLLMNFEPDPEEVLDAVIPKYINSLIYGALMEAVASENGARMTAMDNATSNAEEMISDLTLSYNRARQGAITQEITEIVSGSEALK